MSASAQNPMQPLYYGPSGFSQNNRPKLKPDSKTQFKLLRKMENIVRLENAAFPAPAIAAMLGISAARLAFIKRQPQYIAVKMQLTHGIILDFDSRLAAIKEQRREILVEMLSPALQTIANELYKPALTLAERKHKTAVALDVLDREGTFAKVSRTEIKPVDHFDFEQADEASRSLVHAIRGTASPAALGQGAASAGLEANKEFANSHTLSAVDQQAALETLEGEVVADELDALVLEALPTDGTVN